MFWSKLTLVQKLSVWLILTCFLPLLIVGGTSYHFSSAALKKQASRLADTILRKQEEALALQLEQVEALTAHLAGIESITEALQLSDKPRDSFDELAMNARIGYILNGFLNIRGLVSIDLFGMEGSHYHVGDTLQISEARPDVKAHLFSIAQSNPGTAQWPGLEENINAASTASWVVPAVRLLKQINRENLQFEPIGLIVANISVDYLYTVLSKVDLPADGYLMVVDQDGKIIYHPDRKKIATAYDLPLPLNNLSRLTSSTSVELNGRDMSLNHVQSSQTGWHILSLVPSRALAAQSSSIGAVTLLAILVSLLLVIISVTATSRTVVLPIQNIITSFKKYQKGDLDLDHQLPPHGKDEVAELVQWFNTFIDALKLRQQAEKDLKLAKADLEKANLTLKKLSQAVEHSPMAVIIADATGKVEYINPKFTEMTGFSHQDISDWTLKNCLRDDQHQLDYSRVLKTVYEGQDWRGEIQNKRKDGSLYWEAVTISPVMTERGKVTNLVVIKEDVTSLKYSEEALRRMQKMEAVGQLTGGIAHDFNNILSIIQGNLTLLQRQLAGDDHAQKRIENALSGTVRGADITKKLLSFSRKEAHQTSTVSICSQLANLEALISSSLTAAIEVNISIDPDLWAVKIDAGDLEDAILNLVLNARDAMPDGGTLTIQASNKTLGNGFVKRNPEAKPGNYVMILVSDTGTGMTRELKERILEPFFTTKAPGKGTGLGLSMVYGFVQRSSGHLDIRSEIGEGTSFRIYLPKAQQSEGFDQRQVDLSIGLPQGTETVLVVEDEPALLEVAVSYLEFLGYRTISTESPQAALDILRRDSSIDLLFSDIIMPGKIDGYQLAAMAHKENPYLKILLASGFTKKRDDHGQATTPYLDGLSSRILGKPYNQSELAVAVRQALDWGQETAEASNA